MSEPQRERRIGGIWRKTTKGGADYLSLSLNVADLRRILDDATGERISLAAFANRTKRTENHPDFEIMPPMRRESRVDTAPPLRAPATREREPERRSQYDPAVPPRGDGDIPF